MGVVEAYAAMQLSPEEAWELLIGDGITGSSRCLRSRW